jgi:hypothetical protein
MSWSVGAIGKAAAVRTSIAKQFEGTKCVEPEETVRKAAAALIDAALGAQSSATAVKVLASGSQSSSSTSGVSNSLMISVEPQYGFVE